MFTLYEYEGCEDRFPAVSDAEDYNDVYVDGKVSMEMLQQICRDKDLKMVLIVPTNALNLDQCKIGANWAVVVRKPRQLHVIHASNSRVALVKPFVEMCFKHNLYDEVVEELLANWVYSVALDYGVETNVPCAMEC